MPPTVAPPVEAPHAAETRLADPRTPPPRTAEPRAAPPAPSYHEPFDPEYVRALERELLAPLADHYFRPRLVNGERLPARGPVILAANHSGNCLPYDAIVLDGYLWCCDGMDPRRKLRTVFEKELTLSWWLRPFGVDDLYRRGGGVDMTFDNFERLLLGGERVLYFPEGVPGIGKGFQNRYHLQPFHSSFATLAARHDVPVVPVHIVNAEWVMPFHFTLKPVDWVMQRVFRVPFLPLPAGIIACLWPWLWFLALPANLVFVVGEAIDVRAVARDLGIADPATAGRDDMLRVAAEIRRRMQAELDGCVRQYGQRPYDARSLWRALRRAGKLVWRVLPTGWPAAFNRFERDRQRPPARNRLHALLRDLDLAAFYIPFGWPLLSLARAFRRPPYGYRGLPRAEARRRRGEFVWHLSERPLPPRSVRFGED
jgi:1-acyl-sn-glycerol-3-phosphate acyltransferase